LSAGRYVVVAAGTAGTAAVGAAVGAAAVDAAVGAAVVVEASRVRGGMRAATQIVTCPQENWRG